jgi:hypothetical protein
MVQRRFRRFGLDGSLVGAGVGIVTCLNSSTGIAPPWIALGATSADIPSAPGLVEFGAATQFALTDVIQYAQLQAMFNEYQINKVELKFSLDCAPSFTQGNGGIPNTMPSVYIAYDPNDSTVPAGSDLVMGRSDVQYHSLQRPFTFTFYPRCAQALYVGAVTTGYAAPNSSRSLWLDTSPPSQGTAHYGVKMWFRNFQPGNGSGLVVRIQPIFHMTFRRMR